MKYYYGLDAQSDSAARSPPGASFLRRDGSVWTTDKDDIILALLASEILATTGQTDAALRRTDREVRRPDTYARVDAPADREPEGPAGQTVGRAGQLWPSHGQPLLRQILEQDLVHVAAQRGLRSRGGSRMRPGRPVDSWPRSSPRGWCSSFRRSGLGGHQEMSQVGCSVRRGALVQRHRPHPERQDAARPAVNDGAADGSRAPRQQESACRCPPRRRVDAPGPRRTAVAAAHR